MSKPIDRTTIAVKRQLSAMNAPLYELGIFDRHHDKMLPRTWCADEILAAIGWLKAMNIKGNDIYIRPAGSLGLVFFDDLGRGTIDKMTEAGLAPAVLIESSPSNYQGWIRVSNSPLPEALATAACKVIAQEYGGDVDSADWRHYGRLAGFTNRKPAHVQRDGKYPFVLLSESGGKLADNRMALLGRASQELAKREAEREERRKALAAPPKGGETGTAITIYRGSVERLVERYGASLDRSRMDWMIVTDLAQRGFAREQIEAAMYECSLALDTRQSRADRYIQTTLDNALGL